MSEVSAWRRKAVGMREMRLPHLIMIAASAAPDVVQEASSQNSTCPPSLQKHLLMRRSCTEQETFSAVQYKETVPEAAPLQLSQAASGKCALVPA